MNQLPLGAVQTEEGEGGSAHHLCRALRGLRAAVEVEEEATHRPSSRDCLPVGCLHSSAQEGESLRVSRLLLSSCVLRQAASVSSSWELPRAACAVLYVCATLVRPAGETGQGHGRDELLTTRVLPQALLLPRELCPRPDQL